MKKKISLIVPCYNEEEALPFFYKEISRVSDEMNNYDFELIFVDDGSKDKTLETLQKLSAKDKRITYISFSRNFGKEAAMYAGFINASGEYVAVMDADMQDPPSLLPEMAAYLTSGEYDSVATRRVNREGEPRIRSFFARAFYRIINKISDADIVDGARDYRLMKREMVDAIIEMGEYNRFSKGIYGWVGFKTKWLPFQNAERIAGETKWSFWKLFKYSLDGIINFSQVPLSIASWSGILLTGIALLIILFICIRKLLFGDPVAGWASLTCIIMFIGGIQLFCMGIIGQYLSKMYLEIKKRPHYIVRQTNREDTVKKVQ
ncbi:glycosyltransferase family 2 protein [Novisyntrophococcus fermenticellae]|uniref:glycosyltransferase family 2 protein n=1 Tax=Novisyntrophococcus fermenticellae TaxID=2068655 RepID=UPI001E57E60B|nr:glycosyltransferase family 2 protein [Novisyntrophococcus fermenticellae]